MRLVERMTIPPGTCLYCGKGNTPDDDSEEIGPFLDLERDHGWGDPTYLCGRCIAQAAGLFGWIDPTQAQELERAVEKKGEEIHELKADLDGANRRIRAITHGKKGLRSARNREKAEV